MGQLTPRELDCLRLVARGRSSKEIAIELGISPYTVDEYIRTAVSKLGVRNRRQAAQIVTSPTQIATPEKTGDEPQAIAAEGPAAPLVGAARSKGPRWRVPFLRQGRQINDLNAAQRLFWILVIAVAIIILFSQLSQGMAVIQAIFRGR